jgi:hypothetical protein
MVGMNTKHKRTLQAAFITKVLALPEARLTAR